MASVPPRNAVSLAQSVDPANLDGAVTLEEAIGQTDGIKLLQLERPIVVSKPLGAVRVGDLPAKEDISETLKKNPFFHIVKYIKFTENTKVSHQTILNMCSGRACEVDLQNNFARAHADSNTCSRVLVASRYATSN